MMFVHIILFAITSVLVFLFTFYTNVIYFMDKHTHWFGANIQDKKMYDYIVVGAGSAGSIIAEKLAEDKFNTLLIEAGGTAPPFFDIPILAPLLQGTPYDWQYITVPQQNACKALINNQSRWPMGKIVGGTSRFNYMAYVLGHPNDYLTWFPDFTEPTAENGGPMEVNELRWHTKIADVVLQGVRELGLKIGNINKDIDTGFMKVQLSMKNGSRWSSDNILNKKLHTLTIVTHAFVEKILIKSKKAVGIRFKKLGKVIHALARKGVILSAGAIGSPKLLMLSGIGPKEHLEQMNINVINDLPVGQNLVDHLLTGLDLVTLNISLPLSVTTMLNPASMLKYFFYGEGPWTHSGIEVLGTFHSYAAKNESVPDLQFMIIPTGVSKDHGTVLKQAMGISDKVYDEYFSSLASQSTVTIAPVLLHPKSTGKVYLNSNDPYDYPQIDPKYLSNESDVSTLIDGLNFVKKLLQTDAMKTLEATLYNKKFPGCEDKIFDTREYWKCYIQHVSLTSYHPAGTCRMGDVVDDKFRVYNMTNLYVVDASVLPILPSGNINAAVIMLAERAIQMFRQTKRRLQNSYKCYKSHHVCYVFKHTSCNASTNKNKYVYL